MISLLSGSAASAWLLHDEPLQAAGLRRTQLVSLLAHRPESKPPPYTGLSIAARGWIEGGWTLHLVGVFVSGHTGVLACYAHCTFRGLFVGHVLLHIPRCRSLA